MKNEETYPNESHLKSILKAFSWRILATGTTAIIAYFITGAINVAILIGGIEFFVKFILYYVHERLWQLMLKGAIRRHIAFSNRI